MTASKTTTGLPVVADNGLVKGVAVGILCPVILFCYERPKCYEGPT